MNDKKNNRIYIILITGFILLCLIPSAGLIVAGPSEPAANEILSPLPRLRELDGSFNADFLTEAASWFDCRFVLRNELSTGWAKLNAVLLGSSVNDDVILGKKGWLFYASSVPDYCGELLSEEKLCAAAANIAEISRCCDECGTDFVFVVAPNKSSLYPSYMPSVFPEGETANVRYLYEKLDELGVNRTDLHGAFMGEQEVLYFKTDSHWNSRGAALASDEILSALGRPSGFWSSSFNPREGHRGDLYEMLYPSGRETETDFLLASDFRFREEGPSDSGEAIEFTTVNPDGNGRLLCFRDSFGVSLYPYLAESFREADFSRSMDFDLQRIREGNYSCVVLEIVERNISWLA